MNAADKERFSVTLTRMAAAFAFDLTAEIQATYWATLSDLSQAAFAQGCTLALKRLKFFPRVAEIRELAAWKDPMIALREGCEKTQRYLSELKATSASATPAPMSLRSAWNADQYSSPSYVQACIDNVNQSAEELARAKARFRQADPGTEALANARMAVTRARIEQAHWLESVEWHRKRLHPSEPTQSALPEPQQETWSSPGGAP